MTNEKFKSCYSLYFCLDSVVVKYGYNILAKFILISFLYHYRSECPDICLPASVTVQVRRR